jgi:hypothetical protein
MQLERSKENLTNQLGIQFSTNNALLLDRVDSKQSNILHLWGHLILSSVFLLSGGGGSKGRDSSAYTSKVLAFCFASSEPSSHCQDAADRYLSRGFSTRRRQALNLVSVASLGIDSFIYGWTTQYTYTSVSKYLTFNFLNNNFDHFLFYSKYFKNMKNKYIIKMYL